jgi:hypothetical protein
MVTPICCGQPARYVVQGMTLQYWFCDTCRKEPAATVTHPTLEVVSEETTPSTYSFQTLSGSGSITLDPPEEDDQWDTDYDGQYWGALKGIP